MLLLLSLLSPASAVDVTVRQYMEEDVDQRLDNVSSIRGCVPSKEVMKDAQTAFDDVDATIQARKGAYEDAVADLAAGLITEDELMEKAEEIAVTYQIDAVSILEDVARTKDCMVEEVLLPFDPKDGVSCDDHGFWATEVEADVGPFRWRLTDLNVDPYDDAITGTADATVPFDAFVYIFRRALICVDDGDQCRRFTCIDDEGVERTRRYDLREMITAILNPFKGKVKLSASFRAEPQSYSDALGITSETLAGTFGFFGTDVTLTSTEVDLESSLAEGTVEAALEEEISAVGKKLLRKASDEFSNAFALVTVPLALPTTLMTADVAALPLPYGGTGGPSQAVLSSDLESIATDYVDAVPGGEDADGEEMWDFTYSLEVDGVTASGPATSPILERKPDADFGIDLPTRHIASLLEVPYAAKAMERTATVDGVDVQVRVTAPPRTVVTMVAGGPKLEIAFPLVYTRTAGGASAVWEGTHFVEVEPYVDDASASAGASMVALDVDWSKNRVVRTSCSTTFPRDAGCVETETAMVIQTPAVLLPADLPLMYTYLDVHTKRAPVLYSTPILGDKVALSWWDASTDHLALYFKGPEHSYE